MRRAASRREKDQTMSPDGTTSKPRIPLKPERRVTRRCKITQVMRVRPSNPANEQFDDVRGTLSVSRSGVYFHSELNSYEVGMRLFLTLPYSQDPTAVDREYLGEVARVEPLVTGQYGIGVKLLMEVGMPPTFVEPSGAHRK